MLSNAVLFSVSFQKGFSEEHTKTTRTDSNVTDIVYFSIGMKRAHDVSFVTTLY